MQSKHSGITHWSAVVEPEVSNPPVVPPTGVAAVLPAGATVVFPAGLAVVLPDTPAEVDAAAGVTDAEVLETQVLLAST